MRHTHQRSLRFGIGMLALFSHHQRTYCSCCNCRSKRSPGGKTYSCSSRGSHGSTRVTLKPLLARCAARSVGLTEVPTRIGMERRGRGHTGTSRDRDAGSAGWDRAEWEGMEYNGIGWGRLGEWYGMGLDGWYGMGLGGIGRVWMGCIWGGSVD